MKKHKNGFTLAEVLITLVIIGVIAAMTIPTLMNKTNEQETVVAVKKAYSILAQAYQRMVADYGELNPSYFGSTDEEFTKNFGDMFVKYLNVQKNCGVSTNSDCLASEGYGIFSGKIMDDDFTRRRYKQIFSSGYNFVLSDGMSVNIRMSVGNNDYGVMFVDVNGQKGPNVHSVDYFAFNVNENGVSPDIGNGSFGYECRYQGNGCTAWVVTKGNMDYLKKDVSW